MKIAVACDGNFVSGHFGHCEGFSVFDVENNNNINDQKFMQNPGHKPGFLPPYLAEKGINVIISGGMGATAQQLFNDQGISVIVGAQGKSEDVVKQYISGELKSTGSVCEEHMHHGHCHG